MSPGESYPCTAGQAGTQPLLKRCLAIGGSYLVPRSKVCFIHFTDAPQMREHTGYIQYVQCRDDLGKPLEREVQIWTEDNDWERVELSRELERCCQIVTRPSVSLLFVCSGIRLKKQLCN